MAFSVLNCVARQSHKLPKHVLQNLGATHIAGFVFALFPCLFLLRNQNLPFCFGFHAFSPYFTDKNAELPNGKSMRSL